MKLSAEALARPQAISGQNVIVARPPFMIGVFGGIFTLILGLGLALWLQSILSWPLSMETLARHAKVYILFLLSVLLVLISPLLFWQSYLNRRPWAWLIAFTPEEIRINLSSIVTSRPDNKDQTILILSRHDIVNIIHYSVVETAKIYSKNHKTTIKHVLLAINLHERLGSNVIGVFKREQARAAKNLLRRLTGAGSYVRIPSDPSTLIFAWQGNGMVAVPKLEMVLPRLKQWYDIKEGVHANESPA